MANNSKSLSRDTTCVVNRSSILSLSLLYLVVVHFILLRFGLFYGSLSRSCLCYGPALYAGPMPS